MSLDLQINEPNAALYPSSTFDLPNVADSSTASWVRPQVDGPEQLFSYRVVKRAVDVAAVLFLCVLLAPVLAVIAVAVWLTSPGPVLFSHRRIRRHGQFFTMWKFRTMCMNSGEVLERYLVAHPEARAEWRATHKLKCDPRVTRVGRFLRRTSLDELPQLWNVLNGTMSLVGPRPIVAAEVEKYGEFFWDYCAVKPGVTGLWQVSGRSELTYAQRVELDRHYAQNWSLGADAKILMRTCSCVVNRDGAY
ncbi:MAG TPA: sugar transferase [Acidobacteriaceae bacterium]|nr:sugar transferase [Acidobacteriaceae bacterium]